MTRGLCILQYARRLHRGSRRALPDWEEEVELGVVVEPIYSLVYRTERTWRNADHAASLD